MSLSRRTVLAGAGAIGFLSAVGYDLRFNVPSASAIDWVQYQYPFVQANVSQYFSSSHNGVDMPKPEGTSIAAVADGSVASGSGVVFGFDYGYWALIAHADGKSSFYGHMKQAATVTSGTITRGSQIGLTGNTGGKIGQDPDIAIGQHLHLGLRNATGWEDPLAWINSHLGTSSNATGDDTTMIYMANTSSTDGLIQNGYVYVNDASGPLRALSSLEGAVYLTVHTGLPRVTWGGNDIRQLVKIVGLRQQGAPQGLSASTGGIGNDGRLTGTIVY